MSDFDLQSTILYIVGSIGLLFLLIRSSASTVYDILIVKMTSKWYFSVLEKLDEGDRVLDVGIGTGTALLKNKDLILKKKLKVVGVDYDKGYIDTAGKQIESNGLSKECRVMCKSIFDEDLSKYVLLEGEEKYDAAYFSGSWTLMPEPARALHIASSFVKDDGRIYITQTFQRKNSPIIGVIKPLLKHITTIDFGNLHYEADLERYLNQAKSPVNGVSLVVEKNTVVPNSIDNAYQAARLIILKKVKV